MAIVNGSRMTDASISSCSFAFMQTITIALRMFILLGFHFVFIGFGYLLPVLILYARYEMFPIRSAISRAYGMP